ncbi:MAG: hypothetical protein ABI304_07805 [Rudaea sp.]
MIDRNTGHAFRVHPRQSRAHIAGFERVSERGRQTLGAVSTPSTVDRGKHQENATPD